MHAPAGAVVELAMQPFECSSTQIRALARDGSPQARQALAAILTPGVLDYIEQHRLYV
jgi:nicotinic acid mononucleotide adenylyltransferase